MSKIISIFALIFAFFVAVFAFGAKPVKYTEKQSQYLAALQIVETGGMKNGGRDAVGDGGKAIGPLQIWEAYWDDSGVYGKYESCKDLEYAKSVVAAYAQRYEPAAWKACDVNVLARLHNGGPGWRKKKAKTDGYLAKVREAMKVEK